MMNQCFLKHGLILSLAAVLAVGCSKSDPASGNKSGAGETSASSAAPAELVAKLHWLGKHALSQETKATNFMAIWQLPESAKLEGQTLDKLATAPWRLLAGVTPLSNAPVSLLRPLLDDLVQAESYLEVRATTNQPGELAIAIRLDPSRAALWQSNLPVILKSLIPGDTLNFQLARGGDWLLFALSDSRLKTRDSKLMADFQARIQRDHTPSPGSTTNDWLEVQADLLRVRDALALNWRLPSETPGFRLALRGEGDVVLTSGTVTLARPVSLPLDPWRIPVSALPKALTSFTAWRGLASLVPPSAAYSALQVGNLPDQLFVWSLPSFPMQSVVVVPLAPNDQRPALIQHRLLTAANQWIATNSVGHWTEIEGGAGLQWEGAPFMTPFVRPFTGSAGDYLGFGLLPTPLTNAITNSELPARLVARTNAVYYDWEFTGPRIESWFYMGQLGRVILGRGQLPLEAAATYWLKALQPKLSNSGTVVTLVSPTKLVFERTSTFGFTAFELHLLADWFESPRFPYGLVTTEVAVKRKLSAMPVGPAPTPAKP